jgi:hypothetical protein
MRYDLKKQAVALAAMVVLGGYSAAWADTPITSFTPGDIVLLRGGDPTNPSTGTTVTLGAYLDEYTPAGVYQGTIGVPQATSGSNNPLTITSGPGSHEGILTLSDNGQWLTFGGYDTAPTSSSSGAGVSQVTVGEIGSTAASLNTSTLMSANTIRAGTTVDGNEFWISNSPGVQYVSGTGGSSTDTTLNSTYNTRALATVNSTLVAGSGSASLGTHGIWQLGTSGTLPTTSIPSITLLSGATPQDGTDFIFADQPNDALSSNLYQGKYNVLYSVGGASGSATINKYEYNGSTFTLLNSKTPVAGGGDTLIGVTDIINGSNSDLYYTDNGGLYELVDSNNASSPLPNSGALLTAAPTGQDFYGVAVAPVAVPEPGSIGLLAAAAGISGLLSRRRRLA